MDFVHFRPVGPLVGRRLPRLRVNSKRKQPVERRMERCKSGPFSKQIPVERFEMSKVENQSMSLGDRPIVQRIRSNQSKQNVRTGASVGYSLS
jgi:hypothetical protein